MQIAIVNQATTPLGVDLAALLAVCQKQLDRHFAPAWQLSANLQLADSVPTDGAAIILQDDTDIPGAEGLHDDPDGAPRGYVFVRETLADGGKVSVTFSHELLELLVDPDTTQCVRNPKNGWLYAKEVCDAVESNEYLLDGISVSNFVHPAWFSARSKPGLQLDHLWLCRRPFEIRPGGYMPVFKRGRWTQVFGDKRPDYNPHRHYRAPRIIAAGNRKAA